MSDDVSLPTLGTLGWLRFVWRRLTSMSTALLLLLLLAVAAVPGSVFPQRRVDAGRVNAYLAEHTVTGPWLDRFGFFDVYSSPWFAAVYLLLFVSLVGCVVPRARLHWRAMRARPPRTPRTLSRLPVHAGRTTAADPDQVLAAAREALRGRRYRLAQDDLGARGTALAAEKGYLSETGNLLFHLALLGVLVAVAVGSLFSWTGQATVVEGEGFSNTLPMYNEFRPGTRVDTAGLEPFSFTLDRLDVAFDEEATGGQFGAPRRFDASVTVTDEPGAAPRTALVRPNEPLDVGPVRAFLVGNGYAPVVTVRDARGEVAFSGPVIFNPRDGNYTSQGVVKVPDAAPNQLAFNGFFLPTAVFDPRRGPISIFPDDRTPRLVLTAYRGDPGEDDLGVDDGTPQSVFQIDPSRLTQLTEGDQPLSLVLAPGQTTRLPDGLGSITFDEVRRFAAFDVHSDPSKGWALAAAVAALSGLMLSLFVRRRRIWVRVATDDGGRTVVEVAGLARTQDEGLAEEVGRLLDAAAPQDAAVPAVATKE